MASSPSSAAPRVHAMSRYPWRTFAALVAAGTLTGPLVLPYAKALNAITGASLPPMSTTGLIGATLLRNLVFLVPATGLGLLLARPLGLGAPYFEHRLDGGPVPPAPARTIVVPAVLWAVVTALVAFAVDAGFVRGLGITFPAPEIHARIDVAWWQSAPACLWAPWSEEIFDRLFLMSLVAWLGMRLFRVGTGRGRTAALWVANVATALFFGWYHLSNEHMFATHVPPLVELRTVLIIFPGSGSRSDGST
jgi:hypothetical protein